MIGIYELPVDNAKRALPSGFLPYSALPTAGITASFLFHVIECERVTAANRVFGQAAAFHSIARVRPANGSWGERDVPSRFSLDLFVTSAELGEVLAGFGVPSRTSELRKVELADPGIGTEFALHAWKFESTEASFEVEFYNAGLRQGGTGGKDYYWLGNDSAFTRADAQTEILYDADLPAGVLRATGATRTGQAWGSCCIAWAGQGFYHYSSQWSLNGTTFQAQPGE